MDWRDNVVTDLLPFADPGAEGPAIQRRDISESSMELRWSIRGRNYRKFLQRGEDGAIRVSETIGPGGEPFVAFLAGPSMADITSLATMTLRLIQERPYVSTRARLKDEQASPAITVVENLARDRGERQGTALIFVTADAGGGKSFTLRHVARRRAADYSRTKSGHVYLYVDAQGRALARFDEALATTLDDLRSTLTYNQIPPLVRHGLLVPIIDGFDELIETAAVDSMSTLTRFLDELAGLGMVVACTRSAYYEQQFAQRAQALTESGASWYLQRVEMEPWQEAQQRELVRLLCEAKGRHADTSQVFSTVNGVLRNAGMVTAGAKPFFVSALCELVLDGVTIEPTTNPVHVLVDAYARREVEEKLLDKAGRSLVAKDKLLDILQGVAEEMWLSETRALSVADVVQVIQLHSDSIDLPELFKQYLTNRTAIAFLRASGAHRIEFEHEIFFSFLIGRSVAAELAAGGRQLRWLLARSACTKVTATVAVELAHKDVPDLHQLVTVINELTNPSYQRYDLLQENGGRLLAAAIRYRSNRGETLQKLHIIRTAFLDEDFGEVRIADSVFRDTRFNGCQLSQMVFERCQCPGTTFTLVTVDPKMTRLDIKDLDPRTQISGLRRKDDPQPIYRPAQIDEILRACGVAIADELGPEAYIAPDALALVERLATSFRQTNVIWPEDPAFGWLRNNAKWPALRDLLVGEKIIESDPSPNKGIQRPRFRGTIGWDQLLDGLSREAPQLPAIQRFWNQMRKVFPNPDLAMQGGPAD